MHVTFKLVYRKQIQCAINLPLKLSLVVGGSDIRTEVAIIENNQYKMHIHGSYELSLGVVGSSEARAEVAVFVKVHVQCTPLKYLTHC